MINPDIRDGAYQFFIEEAPELLEIIESGLLTLRDDRSKPKVHEIMRAAHSLKGGAASVELDTIKIIAHRLEDIFKAFYDETVEIDGELESNLLKAYDCLRDPLMEQIETGSFDEVLALEKAMPICATIEQSLGDSLIQGEQYIPSSQDLGVDIVSSIFEVDFVEGLDHLATMISNSEDYDLAAELRNQAEVFHGFGELLNLPGLVAIAQAVLMAVEDEGEQTLALAKLALADFRGSYHQVIEQGDRTQGGQPSPELLAWNQIKLDPNTQSLEVAPPNLSFEVEDSQDVGPITTTNSEVSTFQSNLQNQEVRAFTIDNLFEEEPDESDEADFVFPELDFLEIEQLPLQEKDHAPPTHTVSDSTELFLDAPSLDDVFGNVLEAVGDNSQLDGLDSQQNQALEDVFGGFDPLEAVEDQSSPSDLSPQSAALMAQSTEKISEVVQSVEAVFEELPTLTDNEENSPHSQVQEVRSQKSEVRSSSYNKDLQGRPNKSRDKNQVAQGNLSIKVDFERLERMNNLIGELAINRNSLSLQNEQLQGGVRELLHRFENFQQITRKLRETSDEMLVAPERYAVGTQDHSDSSVKSSNNRGQLATDFDSLEMDSYGKLHSLVQIVLDEMVQLEESVDDIVLFARSSNKSLDQQGQMLTNLRDELMWARMLPLAEVLNRFPRVLRDLSHTHNKLVKLELQGTGVLVDKAALEKLYDPLLHLLRNAFDHGIESPEVRRQLGKPEAGQILIRAYHQGNQTMIEIIDDGQGINLDKIAQKAVDAGLISQEQIKTIDQERLQNLIFEPGFSTASQVSDLSGRGVGLDVVKDQLRTLKGKVSVSSIVGKGTTFTLSLPLTLTISKLLVCLLEQEEGTKTAIALPSDSIEEVIMPQDQQLKKSGQARFLNWQSQIIPIYALGEILEYNCAFAEGFTSKALQAVPHPTDWGLPLLIIRQGQQLFALEVTRLITEQELVVKPFGSVLTPPSYIYGCTILGDGTLIPVVNGSILIEQFLDPIVSSRPWESNTPQIIPEIDNGEPSIPFSVPQTPMILVVDDSAALRRTLALTLQKAGYRVLQAKDGKEALEQLHNSPGVQLVICDVEMPNMNGFEFLGKRRSQPDLMEIPVAMLTSRSSEKHRKLATHLGANAYFTKPYIEQQFLEEIKNLMLK
ncbi:MAG TPA: hybrid sensor histidine kinase/response regulator [Cyanothece sp. UBA12306]|nr:hybrid sensor histidine kinase/response regulator [Cyanothece sp. UBA12306]